MSASGAKATTSLTSVNFLRGMMSKLRRKPKPDNRDVPVIEVSRKPTGKLKLVIFVLAIMLSAFQLYTGTFGVFQTAVVHRAVHLLLVLALFFLIRPVSPKAGVSKGWLRADIILACVAAIAVGYIAIFYEDIANRIGNLENLTQIDLVMGVITVILVLEACRRISVIFFAVIVLALVYMIFGNYLSGMLSHRGFETARLIYLLSLSSEGIFGVGLAVSSTYLFLFILFGAFLEVTGVGKFFLNFALALVGRFTGGPAKACVVASTLMGTMTGSSIVEVVTIGPLTIPLMKKTGFRDFIAGGVECVSAMGGQMMPPVMGAGAFIMAEITGTPYAQICLAAILPALIYYTSAFSVVHFEAVNHNLKGLPSEELPNLKKLLLSDGYLLIPVIVLIYFLLIAGFTAVKAGVLAILACIVVTYFRKSTRLGWKGFLGAMDKGARSAVEICALCAGIGLIVSAITLTGLGMRFTTIILSLAGGNQFILLVLSMIVCLVLGMGMATPAAYLLMAMFAAPALVASGVDLIAAHMFCFWFAIISGVTPPVCIVAVVAAGVAGANWIKTAWAGLRFSLASFIIPFMFVLGPALLWQGSPLDILRAAVTATIGAVGIAGVVQGRFVTRATWWQRVILLAGSLCLIDPGAFTDIIGIAILAVLGIYQKFFVRKALAGAK